MGSPKVMKRAPVQQLPSLEASPYPLSSRPERSVVERSAVQRSSPGSVFRQRSYGPMGSPKVMKSGSRSATTIAGSIALPFVIPTGAQRSGEICGSAVLPWKCFSTEELWANGLTQGDEKGSRSATTIAGSIALPFVISTGAQRSGEIRGSAKCFRQRSYGPMGSSKVMKSGSRSATTIAGSIALPFVISTGAQRSGEIRGSAVFSWKCFRQRSYGPMGSSKVMKSGSRSATTIAGSIALPFVISTGAQRSGEIRGSAVFSWKCFRQRSYGPMGSSKVMKSGSRSATTIAGSIALPFVIPTGAQRSGGICGSAVLPWKCFSTEELWANGLIQGDEKRLPFSNYHRWKHRPTLCHLDRSAA